MYIKEGVRWDINQNWIVNIDHQLSFDIISIEFKKTDNIDEENIPIINSLNLSKHYVVFKFTPLESVYKE